MANYKIDTPEMTFAIQFVKAARERIRQAFQAEIVTDWKQDETPITAADRDINDRFIKAVRKEYPGYSILGEEASQPDASAEWAWVIDPIDGTHAFILGAPLFTCCVSLLHNGMPELGVIYDPILDRLFYAQKGLGAYLGSQKLQVTTATTLNRQYVHLESLKTGNRWMMPMRQLLLEAGCIPVIYGASQYAAALTAMGRMAGAVYSQNCFWDGAAPYIIGTEAGAVITDLDGKPQRYDQPINGFILANPQHHAQLLAMVQECAKTRTSTT